MPAIPDANTGGIKIDTVGIAENGGQRGPTKASGLPQGKRYQFSARSAQTRFGASKK